MTNTFKTLLLGAAAIVTVASSGAHANDYQPSSTIDAQAVYEQHAGQENAPSAPHQDHTREREDYDDEAAELADDSIKVSDSPKDGAIANGGAVTSRDVESVQKHLNEQGFDVSVDGVVGNQTRAALKSYQAANNLPATGNIDAQTIEFMRISSR